MYASLSKALVLVDIQLGFEDPCWGERCNPQFLRNAQLLLHRWRSSSAPLIHVRHLSADPDSPLRAGGRGTAFLSEVEPLPGEIVITKSVNSAFIGTELLPLLERLQVGHLALTGLTTNHCVSTTARMASNLGFSVEIAADATAAFAGMAYDGTPRDAESVHRSALSDLHQEFATVKFTADIAP